MTSKVDLKLLFSKLGHKLEEIRVRALKNICSKLEHKVICAADLIQEKQLFIALLEWFNFPSVSEEDEVLKLILCLSKHSSGAQILLDIGAVAFFSNLRRNSEQGRITVIDEIVENLFKLPEGKEPEQEGTPCLFIRNENQPPSRNEPWKYDPNRDGAQVGYFSQNNSQDENELNKESDSESGFKFPCYPWLSLTATDRHVLESTNSSLCSKDEDHVVSACEFLCDVVFPDFPAEIFIQRPAIVKSLLSLLKLSEEKYVRAAVEASNTLSRLSAALHSRLRYYQDPIFYTPKADVSVSNSSSSDPSNSSSSQLLSHGRLRGDGRDGESSSARSSRSNSSSSHPPPISGSHLEDRNDIMTLQFNQVSLPHYCVMVIIRATENLCSDSEKIVAKSLDLLHETLKLLMETITESIWTDHAAASKELVENLKECLENISNALQHHHHLVAGQVEGNDISMHRMAYVGTGVFLSQLMISLIPVSVVEHVLPDSLKAELFNLVFDEAIAQTYSNIRHSLIPYLAIVSPDEYMIYQSVMKVCLSMQSTCKFLLDSQNAEDADLSSCLAMAEDSLSSVRYHRSKNLILQLVKLASQICRQDADRALLEGSQSVLLKYLAFPVPQIRQMTYTAVLDMVKNCLNVEEAATPNSNRSAGIRFLINQHMLYEMCCFGMTDSQADVSSIAQELVLYLLQSELLLPGDQWQTVLQTVTTVLPILQGFSDAYTPLGQCVIGLVQPDPHSQTSVVPRLERLRGTLRMLFSAESRVRSEGLSRLAWFMTHEEGITKLPSFAQLDISKISSRFVIDNPIPIHPSGSPITVFTSDEMLKVFEIFHSTTVEAKVKKSAADQLAIMMQDGTLHKAFMRRGGLDKIFEIINAAIVKPTMSEQQNHQDIKHLLTPCVTMLQYLLYYDSSLRHRLSHEMDTYLPIVRSSLMLADDGTMKTSAACVLALMLFDEVSAMDVWNEDDHRKGFSVPAFVMDRFKFPFACNTHHITSPHRISSPPVGGDPLQAGMPAEMLRCAWNVAWHGDIELLLKNISRIDSFREDPSEYSQKLLLSAIDKLLLKSTYLPTCLLNAIYGVMNAHTHEAVQSSIIRLKSYLTCSKPFADSSLLHKLKIPEAFQRFLQVIPASGHDEKLLAEILSLFRTILNWAPDIDVRLASWMQQILDQPKGPIMNMLARPDARGEMGEKVLGISMQTVRHLNRHLLMFVDIVVSQLSYSDQPRKLTEPGAGDLAQNLCSKLNVSDAPHFYNLSALETTIQCLMHITARPGWSDGLSVEDGSTGCEQLLSCLLEVISAFHLGRADVSLTYMGRGVTKCAAICLNQLAQEMAVVSNDKDWPLKWLFTQQEKEAQAGLHWLFPLWAYRDPIVRCAGLGIAVTLSSTSIGQATLVTSCQHLNSGIWGIALDILLDHYECSMVRRQAALLLINLTSQPMPSGIAEAVQNVWQGPVVQNEENGVSLVGTSALLILLHHRQFYQEILILLANYYPHPAIQPTSVTSTTPSGNSSQTTEITGTPGSGSSNVSNAADQTISIINSTINEALKDETELKQAGQVLTSTPDEVLKQNVSGSLTPASRRSTPRVARASPRMSPRAAGQGHMYRAASRAASSIDSEPMPEYQAVATPALVAGVCHLLTNLVTIVPHDTMLFLQRENILQVLLCMLEDELLEAYCAELRTAPDKRYYTVFSDIMDMYAKALVLLQACCYHDVQFRALLHQYTDRMKKVAKLLAVNSDGTTDVISSCNEMKQQVYNFFSTLLSLGRRQAFTDLTNVFVPLWDILTDSMTNIIGSKTEMSIQVSCLHAMALIFKEGGKINSKGPEYNGMAMTDVLAESKKSVKAGESQATGSILCETLVTAYDSVAMQVSNQDSVEKLAVIGALKSLLAVSQDAKQYALDAGLVESIAEHIKHTHAKLNAESLQLGRSSNKSKKEEQLMHELIMTFDLLRNFMYQNYDVKASCHQCGLSSILHKMWSWCLIDGKLMNATLSLIATYCARCPNACSSLAFTSPVAVSDVPGPRTQHSNNSMVHCLIKQVANKNVTKENSSTLKLIYDILATLMQSAECRGILWKSNFLLKFSTMAPKKTTNAGKKPKEKQMEEMCWLQLLANLSFSTEGQQMILKIKDSVNILIDFCHTTSTQYMNYAVLILRNLCFHAVNKPKLLSNEKLLPCFVTCLKSKNDQIIAIATSALHALLHNNQKARVNMKNAFIPQRIQECSERLNADTHRKILESMMAVLVLIKD
ncbi:rotatin-like [Tubulanus polymorphus]|uniref:rotatin-like n=1 Tax=Tubulanus polymorphus TaxID=672921 RepID=UPI003DA661FE